MKRKNTQRKFSVALLIFLLFVASIPIMSVNASLTANFDWSPPEPTDVEDVHFHDLSSGNIVAWYWDFGDGNMSCQRNPIHRYAENGTYTVRLTVWDDGNDMSTVTKDIIVYNVPPIANAGGNRTVNNATVEFNASLSHDPDGTITTYKWLFGDGYWGSGKVTTHTYSEDGIYDIRLNVTDNDGAHDEDEATIIVDTGAPHTTINITGNLGKNNWYKGNASVTLNATDNLSGINVTLYNLSGEWFHYNGTFNVTEEGVNVLEYYSIDNATNEEKIKSVEIKIDNTLPVTHCDLTGTMGNNNWYVSMVTVSFNATDNLSGIDVIKYKIDDSDWEKYKDSVDVSSNGEHTVYFYSVDNAGNIEEEKNITFKIDKEKPTVHIKKPEQGYIYLFGRELIPTILGRTKIIGKMNATATLTDEYSGAYAVYFKLDDNLLWKDYVSPYEAELPQEFPRAVHTLTVVAYDRAGNSAKAPEEITYIKIL